MKNFFSQIPRLWKGVYLIWVSVHFVLLMVSGNIFSFRRFFYPYFAYGSHSYFYSFDKVRYYDYSEFLVYTIVPILIALAIYYLKPQKSKDK